MSKSRSQDPSGCLAVVVGLILLGLCFFGAGLLFEYSLWSLAGKDLPIVLDMILGSISVPVTIWVAVGCWVARSCGYPAPLLH